MEIKQEIWDVKTLNLKVLTINPKPQYQRTSVWSITKKKLFIDSILRDYDVPKFYLRAIPNDTLFEYEVADGQQRMRAIWEFMSNDIKENYSLSETIINSVNTKNLTYQKLGVLKEKFDNFKLNISIINEATPEEIRSLFARLQMGEQLNQVELRHAMASNIGASIISVVENHDFFKESKISIGRFKHQDYFDHVITLCYYGGTTDVRAKNIENMYKELANAKSEIFIEYFQKANSILDWMLRINQKSKGLFKNKWAFVDMYWLLYKYHDQIEIIDYEKIVQQFKLFEHKRLSNHKKPEELIKDPVLASYDKDMYDYIISFKFSGNIKSNIEKRHQIFIKHFIKNGITLKKLL